MNGRTFVKLRIKREAESRGNITLEAALVLPAFMGVLLLFLSVLQIVSARNLLELSVLRTADELCRWAPIYRNQLTEELKKELFGSLQDIPGGRRQRCALFRGLCRIGRGVLSERRCTESGGMV